MNDLQDIEEMNLSNMLDMTDQIARIQFMVKGISHLTYKCDMSDDRAEKSAFDWCRHIIQNHLEESLEALSKKLEERNN